GNTDAKCEALPDREIEILTKSTRKRQSNPELTVNSYAEEEWKRATSPLIHPAGGWAARALCLIVRPCELVCRNKQKLTASRLRLTGETPPEILRSSGARQT